MISSSRDAETIWGQNEIDVACTSAFVSSGYRPNSSAAITGPAIDTIPPTTAYTSQEIEKKTDAYWLFTVPSWYVSMVPASEAMAPEITKPVSFTRTGRMP